MIEIPPVSRGDFSLISATLSVFWKFKSLDGDLKGKLLFCQSILKKKYFYYAPWFRIRKIRR
jgi:hypothetical protein